MFNSVLIANRGEIALRIARTCREMGLRTIAVYSTPDRDSPVVRFADEAVHIGPAAIRHSYLNIPAIIEAGKATGAEAIHPGYGFLSEDPDFAEICEMEGLTFIGPPPGLIAQFGDKAEARKLMAEAGLPVLPGSERALESTEARELADAIGFPVILKACAGGGGRGLSVVHSLRDFPQAYRNARATANAAFNDGRVYLERFVENARHIEIQVLCDNHGNVLHLGERDCSVQRRHQKLVEETPAPGLAPDLAGRMAAGAMEAARRLGYRGLGTFEFLVDELGRFYFMEINCRIQVEHPVTEMVTGLDLVREQIRVAGGLPASVSQSDISLRGVAIECRLNAEDPEKGFTPTPGTLTEFVPPAGPFIRTDSHATTGYTIPAEYDSLLAKIVSWGPDRQQALNRMTRALGELRVSGPGIRTTLTFIEEVITHPAYQDGKHTTALVQKLISERKER
ncbi:acetyl-CoA carboxylase biotin carboxylase subunit [Nonomuraea fuscirosea]|uniref:biotin carboxylase n=1 Tax=Nonomuraea fuscirosea TaxID=1291556 RepID=A0A2T0MXE9_9ACTN|nr:acetyl-CoA carboxylase biotin carboxylase subunit [Nonomuraea fuscirosea]PRX63778.1 acetyl-CoA carboxylase biotin carboxylase subunit [Nonomuraea fuscirosea]